MQLFPVQNCYITVQYYLQIRWVLVHVLSYTDQLMGDDANMKDWDNKTKYRHNDSTINM